MKRFVKILVLLGRAYFLRHSQEPLVPFGVGQLFQLGRLALRFPHLVSQFRRLELLVLRSRFISKPLSFDATKRSVGARNVVEAKLLALVIAEIELSKVAMQMLFAAMLIDAEHAAFEDAEIPFNGVGAYDGISAHVVVGIFLAAMVNGFVALKFLTKLGVLNRLVSHDDVLFRRVLADDRKNILFLGALHMEGASARAAMDKGQDNVLMRIAAPPFDAFLATYESFVNLDNAAFAAHRRQVVMLLHGEANAMAQMPSGFHAASEHALNLAGRDTLLAGAHKVDDLQPQMQRQMGRLEDGSHTHGKGFAAFVALIKAAPSSLAFHLAKAFRIAVAAMMANWTIWPQARLNVRECGVLILEAIFGKNRAGHSKISYGQKSTSWGLLCQE